MDMAMKENFKEKRILLCTIHTRTCTCTVLHSITFPTFLKKQGSKKVPSSHTAQVSFPAMRLTFHAQLFNDQGIRKVIWQPLIIKSRVN